MMKMIYFTTGTDIMLPPLGDGQLGTLLGKLASSS
jgi:hypothetical protein